MDNDLMAGSRSSHLLDAELDAECLSLLSRHIGQRAALAALEDETYLDVVLPVLHSDGADRAAVARLKAVFAPKAGTKPFSPSVLINRDPLGWLLANHPYGKGSIYVPSGAG